MATTKIISLKVNNLVKFSSFFNQLPHKWGCWNCGMEKIETGYIFTARNETSKYNKAFFKSSPPKEKRWERYCPALIYLDNNFNYLTSKPAKTIGDDVFEDVRIFNWLGQLFLTGTRKNHIFNKVDQFLAGVVGDTILSLPFSHEYPLHQKNWNTIIHNGELFFEQSATRPRNILKYSSGSLISIQTLQYNNFPNLRGNCQTLDLGDYYLGIHHTHVWRKYYHFFTLIEKKIPFNIISVSPMVRFDDGTNSSIQFVAGAVSNSSDLILSYGVQDSDNYVATVSLENVYKIL